MAISSTQQTEILKVVAGLFNAAPGGSNLSSLAAFIEGGNSVRQLADALAANSLFTNNVMAGKVTTDAQAAVLMSNFGLVADSTTTSAGSQALKYFKDAIDAKVGFGKIVYDAVTYLSGTPAAEFATAATLLANKALVAAAYSATTSSTNLSTLQNVLSAVTGTAAYTDADVAAVLAASGSTSGQTFTLTTGVDNILGTTSSDVFDGLSAATAAAATDTLTVTDKIDGSAGTDVLNITVTAANTDVTHGALISNIETINIRNTAATTVDAAYAAAAGVTAVNSNLSTGDVTVTNLATGASAGLIGNAAIVNGALAVGYAASATGAATVNISGGTTKAAGTTGNITITGTGTTSTVINSNGSTANTVATVATAATSKSLTINAAAGLTATAFTTGAETSITVTGAAATGATQTAANNGVTAAVNIGTPVATVTTIDASAMSAGGVGTTLIAGITSFKGGKGTDVVTTAALTSTTASIIDAGTGTDTLILAATAQADTAAEAKLYANFEKLDVGAQTADMSLFTNSTMTGVMVGGNATLSNMTATQAGAVTIYATASGTYGVSGASTVGQLDTLSLTVSDGLSAKNTLTLGNITAAGVETINIAATDHVTVTSLTGAAAMTGMNITGAGNVSVTTAALVANVNTIIDATAATGTVLIDATSLSANGVAIKGTTSSSVNTLTGSAQADTITGGAGDDILSALAGNDTINGGAGSDTITGGAGNDTINVGSGSDILKFATVDAETQVGVVASGFTVTGDIITGMGNLDKINLATGGGTAGGVFADGAIVVGTTFSAGSANEMKLISGSYDATTKVFTAGAASSTNDDYVFQYNGGATATTVNSVLLVDIVGTLTATSAAEIITLTVA